MTWLFPPAPAPALAIEGDARLYPIRRIFCVGRNYADHAAEMGSAVDRSSPVYFTKFAGAFSPSGGTIPYPAGTSDLHHEVELTVALGEHGIFGYTVGLDLTRRDLQAVAKEKRLPWDTAKNFDNSAILAPLTPADRWGLPGKQSIRLAVNGQERQHGTLDQMIWPVPALIAHLGTLYRLGPGDLIMTGTPAGVGPLEPGDQVTARIDGLAPLSVAIAPR